jgi:uncharacterized membrane protein
MGNSGFLKRLRKELPTWAEKGWITPGADEAILNHVATEKHGVRFLTFALSVLGVLLLGSGVITYFAANWDVMSKLSKLCLLFGSMWGAFMLAGYLLPAKRAPHIGQAIVLLAIILFGTNIMLIAQTYHIDSHYPNGILMWTLGGLLTAYLLAAQPALIAAIALSVLWTGMESFGFDRPIHAWFLLVWGSFLPIIFRRKWRIALHGVLIGLLLWSFFSFVTFDGQGRQNAALYLVQIYFMAFLALFLVGRLMASHDKLSFGAGLIQNYAVFAGLLSLYTLSFPELQRGPSRQTEAVAGTAASPFIVSTLLIIGIIAGLVFWLQKRRGENGAPSYVLWGRGLIAVVMILIVVNLFVGRSEANVLAVAFNILLFASVVWLVVAGQDLNNRLYINLAFGFFGLTLISRYFDTFWSLLNRSFFFMAGGVILIAGGLLLEKHRRKLVGQMQ